MKTNREFINYLYSKTVECDELKKVFDNMFDNMFEKYQKKFNLIEGHSKAYSFLYQLEELMEKDKKHSLEILEDVLKELNRITCRNIPKSISKIINESKVKELFSKTSETKEDIFALELSLYLNKIVSKEEIRNLDNLYNELYKNNEITKEEYEQKIKDLDLTEEEKVNILNTAIEMYNKGLLLDSSPKVPNPSSPLNHLIGSMIANKVYVTLSGGKEEQINASMLRGISHDIGKLLSYNFDHTTIGAKLCMIADSKDNILDIESGLYKNIAEASLTHSFTISPEDIYKLANDINDIEDIWNEPLKYYGNQKYSFEDITPEDSEKENDTSKYLKTHQYTIFNIIENIIDWQADTLSDSFLGNRIANIAARRLKLQYSNITLEELAGQLDESNNENYKAILKNMVIIAINSLIIFLKLSKIDTQGINPINPNDSNDLIDLINLLNSIEKIWIEKYNECRIKLFELKEESSLLLN